MAEKILLVIPARIGSSRFPKKPLAMIRGQSLLERVWRIGCAAKLPTKVVIATDSEEIAVGAESFGAEVMMTSESCRTGTDRAAEVASKLTERFDIVFNLQGDAVLTPPWIIDSVLEAMLADKKVEIATAAVLLEGEPKARFIAEKNAGGTSGTSVVFDRFGSALYFSKALIPHAREATTDHHIYRHVGLYGYRIDTLESFCRLSEGELERQEKLEQLRALENGIGIKVVVVDLKGRTLHSVDLPEDALEAERIIDAEGELLAAGS